MPRVGRAGRAPTAAAIPLPWILLTLLVILAVGWLQLRRFESHLAERAAERQQAELAGHEEQGYPSFKTAVQQGPQSSSALCAALLEAAGILPDAQGRRVGVDAAQEDGSAAGGAATREGAAGGAAAEAGAAAAVRYLHARRQLYDSMEAALLDRGLALEASSTQGLGLGDMFTRDGQQLKPVLRELQVPVRAIVLPLRDRQAAGVLEAAVRSHLAPLLPPGGMWVQDAGLFHATVYHASTHLDPVPATPAQVDAEEAAVRAVGAAACPLHVALERVVATPGGAVLACWQVSDGTDVAELRRRLAAALPGASRRQVVQDNAILHTTLARIVALPSLEGGGAAQAQGRQQRQARRGGGDGAAAEEAAVLLQAAVEQMTQELCGLQAQLSEAWFTEEYHKLALALGGRFRQRVVPLQCGGGGGGEQAAAATARRRQRQI